MSPATPPLEDARRLKRERTARTDVAWLVGQAVVAALAGAWAGAMAFPSLDAGGVLGAVVLVVALGAGYGAAYALVSTLLAPLAALQLVRRMRDPSSSPAPRDASERWIARLSTALAVVIFAGMSLAGAVVLWLVADGDPLPGALWRFVLVAMLCAAITPRAIRALG